MMRRLLPLAVVLAAAAAHAGERDAPCEGRGTALVIRASAHALDLCEDGASVAHYTVALPRGGTGKRRSGDARLPLGVYSVGAPRDSTRYHLFIPIAYPTVEERRRGYTGGHIGVHGPERKYRWALLAREARGPSAGSGRAGSANSWFDWTAGCIALARDDEIERIAAWVRRRSGADRAQPLLAHLLR